MTNEARVERVIDEAYQTIRYNVIKEERNINLVVYGDPGRHSAMAKTVGYPAAIASRMVLDGEIQKKGMVVPMTADIYRPMLSRLKQEGICAQENSKKMYH